VDWLLQKWQLGEFVNTALETFSNFEKFKDIIISKLMLKGVKRALLDFELGNLMGWKNEKYLNLDDLKEELRNEQSILKLANVNNINFGFYL
jgi:hypothetical protein